MTLAAGGKVDVTDLAPVRYVHKSASESRTNTTTLANDTDMTIALAAGKTYEVRLEAVVTGAAAGDFKCAWAVTGGVAQKTGRRILGLHVSATDATNSANVQVRGAPGLTTSIPYGVDGSAGTYVHETFLVETTTSGTSGTLVLQWAQNTLNATATILNGATYMVVTTVEAP